MKLYKIKKEIRSHESTFAFIKFESESKYSNEYLLTDAVTSKL